MRPQRHAADGPVPGGSSSVTDNFKRKLMHNNSLTKEKNKLRIYSRDKVVHTTYRYTSYILLDVTERKNLESFSVA